MKKLLIYYISSDLLELPDRYDSYMETWKTFNPCASVLRYDARSLLGSIYEVNRKIADMGHYLTPVERTDMLRWYILIENSLYLDFDMVACKEFPDLDGVCMVKEPVTEEAYSWGDVGPLMYKELERREMEYVYQPCLIYSSDVFDWPTEFINYTIKNFKPGSSPMDNFGPWGLTNFIDKYGIEINELDPNLYLKKTDDSYCYHLSEGSWLDWSKENPWG